MYIEAVPNRDSPPAILLRESYREDGKVRKRTLANLSSLSAEIIEGLKVLLRGGVAVPDAQEVFTIERSLPHGHVAAVLAAARQCDAPAWFASAFNVFLLRQFFMGIPKELEESAMLDGCSSWGCFWRIMLPLAKPALAVVALFHFLTVWNDLLSPLIYLSHQEQFTLALGLQFLQAKAGDTPWNQLMAAATLTVIPVLILFFLAQKTFIRGITTTGLKG